MVGYSLSCLAVYAIAIRLQSSFRYEVVFLDGAAMKPSRLKWEITMLEARLTVSERINASLLGAKHMLILPQLLT